MSGLRQQVAETFAAGGALARREPGFRPREAQNRLADAVGQAVEARSSLVAEAGTGVGKTFAYLVPLLLSGARALVSTATKSLQDQLFLRDLPRLRDALGVPVTLALLKGRSSYLCLHRLAQARLTAQLPDRWAVRQLARVEAWATATRTGDLAEVEGLDERSPVIPLVSSTRDNCLGSDCPDFARCHVVAARREAMAADLVVVNHHLFFADLALRDSGVAELLPTVDVAVFDEAHQLVEAGVQFLGHNLGTGQVIDVARDLLAAGLQHARGLQDWQGLSGTLDKAARDLRLACAGGRNDIRGTLKLRFDECASEDALHEPLAAVAQAAEAAAAAADAVEGAAADFDRLAQRCRELAGLTARFNADLPMGHVRWVDLSTHQARLVESPLDIRAMLTEQRQKAPKAWVFTSATLGDGDDFAWFTRSTGLEDAAHLRVGSPFDYPAQARLWVPQRMPQPADAGHPAAVGTLAARIAHRLQGRCFVLTTTLRVLPLIADAARAWLERHGGAVEVLVQGSEPRRSLLQRFGDGHGRLLVGSHSFWEGIDMPGDALQCVLIDKLPFPPPNDPLVEARVRQLKAEGQDPFDAYFVAEAAVALKQGAGRLIRTEADHGLLVLCDPRLRGARYGARLLAALPPMGVIDDEAQARDWLAALSQRSGIERTG
ncbi:ATP-dependent DNA helicase [Rubrivivax albus]|uniref:ATP-dependent DNA helicase n=1 Tax=Rubrivivax albus TaxID=2499835 RepID=A0A3S2USM0_9BURK|nr:ATP-dependent DNA helicase [Rubrivivax albus]RVT54164.1 ATP-dependent DNA helicase [Rubrivivax albus]